MKKINGGKLQGRLEMVGLVLLIFIPVVGTIIPILFYVSKSTSDIIFIDKILILTVEDYKVRPSYFYVFRNYETLFWIVFTIIAIIYSISQTSFMCMLLF